MARTTGIGSMLAAALLAAMAGGAAAPGAAAADGDVQFTDIAPSDEALSAYRRKVSPVNEVREINKRRSVATDQSFVTFLEITALEPMHARGVPGTVVFDYEGDGDQDIYVTNGSGRANSLFRNRLVEDDVRAGGTPTFEDVAIEAGVAAEDQDSDGACSGDTDNDGDMDLLVLGRSESNRFFENDGDGTFTEATQPSGLGGGLQSHISCTLADFNGDGLLDVAVGNNFNMTTSTPIFVFAPVLEELNQLFLNQGDNRFQDVSAASGFANSTDITWAIAAVDYDQDGDADIFTANDQGAVEETKDGGVDHGFIRIYRNDGATENSIPRFTEVTERAGTMRPGGWMGFSFGDFDLDGQLDFFVTNIGDFMPAAFPENVYTTGDQSARWFLGTETGSFVDSRDVDPTLGGLLGTPFGWGTATPDYDNDGDTDIVYYGGLNTFFWSTADNPGTVLENEGVGEDGMLRFSFDRDATFREGNTDHRLRTVFGVATGDLNGDGFVDTVTAANEQKVASPGELDPYLPVCASGDGPCSPFNETAAFLRMYERLDCPPTPPFGVCEQFRWTGAGLDEGTLAVELNGGNANKSVGVRALGTVGLTSDGTVNRDGVGALVRFTPAGGRMNTRPVLAGSSFASQHDLEQLFGLAKAPTGTIEVKWPGGVRNKLFDVRAGERITFPEIPCSFDDDSISDEEYTECVDTALEELEERGVIDGEQADRFRESALEAREE